MHQIIIMMETDINQVNSTNHFKGTWLNHNISSISTSSQAQTSVSTLAYYDRQFFVY